MRFETLCLVREMEKKRCAFCMYKFAAAFAGGREMLQWNYATRFSLFVITFCNGQFRKF